MKNILVPVEEHELIQQVLKTSLLLAQTFGSYVEGLPTTILAPDPLPAEMAIGSTPLIDPVTRRDTAEAYRLHFERFMATCGAPVSLGWYGDDLRDDSFVGEYARTFDLTVLGRPSARPSYPRLETVQAALFEGGRPVLVVPPIALSTLGKVVLIAWNHSTEASRTVALGLPLLRLAQRVIVLEVADWGRANSTGADLVRSMDGRAATGFSARRHAATLHRAGARLRHARRGLPMARCIRGAVDVTLSSATAAAAVVVGCIGAPDHGSTERRESEAGNSWDRSKRRAFIRYT